MLAPRIPDDEESRLAALRAYHVLDTQPDRIFDDLTELASLIAGTPTALISLVDAHRQWFKARKGLDATETPREISFCGHVVADKKPIVVEDATADERFADNPLVAGPLHIRFYAGVPLRAPEGEVLGTLCCIDYHKRGLSQAQLDALKLVANQVIAVLELRRTIQKLNEAQEAGAHVSTLDKTSMVPPRAAVPVATPAPPAAPATQYRALVVDDNAINQLVARTMLQRLGCSVEVASDGAEALSMASARAFDVILMDCQMPGMDGWTATRELRKRPGKQTPIVGLTGGTGAAERKECFEAGMDDVFTKPVLLADFKRLLEKLPGMRS